MSFTTIDIPHDFAGKGALSLDNQPTQPPEELKRKFDEPSREVVAPAYNRLIGELQDSSAASSLGAVAPTGRTVTSQTVQAGLNKLSTDLATLETNAAPAIANAHTHSNKAVIDKFDDTGTGLTYDGNPVGAVTSVNSQTGAVVLTASDVGALPSTTAIPTKTSDLTNDSNFVADASYVHTDNNYDADAVSKKHSHTNKGVLDDLSDNSGTLNYKGQPIGGGSGDAYKTIKVGTTTLTASGADTIEFVADDNIILTPDSTTTPKQIKIKSTGGGTGSASWGGISGTLSNQTDLQTALNAKADTSSLATVATSGSYNDLSNKPTLATVATSGSYNDLSNKPTIPAAQVNADWDATTGVAAILNKPSVLGHTMTPDPTVPFVPSQQIPTEEDAIVQAVNLAHTASGEGWANDDVPSLNTISQWSNEKNITIEVHGDTTTIDATGIGDWKEDSELVSPTAQDESGWGWVYVPELIGMGSNHTVDFKLTFDPVACGGPVTLGGYILDDTTGYLCIKFGNEIASPSTAIIGIEVIYKRNGRRVVGS